MPLIDASFKTGDVSQDRNLLLGVGPSITVSVCTMTDPANVSATKCEQVLALIDSGACQSMIDLDLATKLGLIEVDKAKASGVGGVSVHGVYMAQILIPELDYHQ